MKQSAGRTRGGRTLHAQTRRQIAGKLKAQGQAGAAARLIVRI